MQTTIALLKTRWQIWAIDIDFFKSIKTSYLVTRLCTQRKFAMPRIKGLIYRGAAQCLLHFRCFEPFNSKPAHLKLNNENWDAWKQRSVLKMQSYLSSQCVRTKISVSFFPVKPNDAINRPWGQYLNTCYHFSKRLVKKLQ